jgi:membrane protein YqaA with SNARE-associated domain
VSTAGLIGGLVGLVLGYLDYRLVGERVARMLEASDRSTTQAERADFARRVLWFRRLFFWVVIIGFGIAGYWIGHAVFA